MDKLLLYISIFAIAIGMVNASYVSITEPLNTTVYNGSSVQFGNLGPGQTVYVTISSATTNQSGASLKYGWNELLVSDLPKGWIAQNSSLYNQQLSVKVTAAPYAANGAYNFTLTAVNVGNYSKIGTLSFKALVDVTPDVFQVGVSPANISTGPGEPGLLHITINNTGVSDSPFEISATNLPAFNLTKSVIALHHTSESFVYPLYEDTPGQYNVHINVTSGSSPLVSKNTDVNFIVQASLLNDYGAIGQGAPTFPVMYEPVYGIMYLISRLFNS